MGAGYGKVGVGQGVPCPEAGRGWRVPCPGPSRGGDGVSCPGPGQGTPPTPVDRHTCENSTFPNPSDAGDKDAILVNLTVYLFH